LTVDPEIEREQVERLLAFRAARDGKAASQTLEALRRDAREDRNLMPGILAAVTARATLGEVASALKTVFGEHRPGG
jgi:methylmalonyl-CoA mutase N-terminal domain/subunit